MFDNQYNFTPMVEWIHKIFVPAQAMAVLMPAQHLVISVIWDVEMVVLILA